MFADQFRGKKVLITGHTGFKGSWLALWLKQLGAKVYGYSLAPHTQPNHYSFISELFSGEKFADINNGLELNNYFKEVDPDVVFHLAAQALVLDSYQEPIETFQTNVMGSLNVYFACLNLQNLKVVISITTDKVYANINTSLGYRESDALGGHDPYSASKAAIEIATESFKKSFLHNKNILMSTVRSGNVIGGGDWAKDRLIPDIVRASLKNESTLIRNPNATRPWQHVLDPLSGYLWLAALLLQGNDQLAESYNFGPKENQNLSVMEVSHYAKTCWSDIKIELDSSDNHPHEAKLLNLNIDKARNKLNWQPTWDSTRAIEETIKWYKTFYREKKIISQEQLDQFLQNARELNAPWV